MKLEPARVSLQDVVKAITSAGDFKATLLVTTDKAKAGGDAATKAKNAIASVKGVQKVEQTSSTGVFSVTLDPKQKTLLTDIDAALKGIGHTLQDPPPPKS